VRVLAAGYQQQGFAAAATAVATELATLLSCDRVSVGVGRRDRVRVVALSHSARFDRRTNLLRAVEGAMAEALLGEETVVHPPAAGEAPVPAVAHQTLAREHGGAVCTVLLSDAARPFGALTFERGAEQPFDAATVELCEAVSALLGPMLADRRRAERGAWARLLGAVGGPLGRLLGRGHLRVKLAALALVAVVATGVLATGPFRVTAPARVEGAVQRALVAPYAGYLASAGAKAGDLVKAGDVLATLDDQDLALERRRLANEREELNKEYRRALAQLDHAESRIVQAQIAQAEARLALLDEQIAKTRLTAPFDGVVVEGDLRDRLGAPVERGEILFELAPLDAYRLVLEVDEHDVGEVAAGQRGRLLLAALPGETLAFAVERITGIAETADGRNCLRVEARLDQAPPQLRPGMEGVGKVEVGERRLLDVWSDGLVKRARLWLWAWGS
jgi:RND family efflux transporter MFP subunit